MKLSILLLAIILASCNTANTGNASEKPALQQSAVQPTPARKMNEPVDLKVIVLPTTDGQAEDSFVKEFKYPATLNLTYTDTFGDKIAAYGTGYQVWVGPKGWEGHAEVGVDGTTAVHLYPTGGSPDKRPHIFYYEIPACVGCVLASAAPYFPDAMKEYKRAYSNGYLAPEKNQGEIHINKVSPTLITYTLPAKDGLLTQGVAYFVSPASGDAYFAEAKFVLPMTDSKLSDFLTNTYIRQRKLN